MIMQDRKELLSAKLEHISVSFEIEHTASQGLGVFNSEEAQVMDTRFVNEVIWVSEIIHDGDLVARF